VAVKVLDKAEVMGTAGMAPRVLREVTAMRRLRHPNVLRLHEVLATRAKIYLVMELATGGDLLSRLAALPWRCLPEHAARRVFVQLGVRHGPAGSSRRQPVEGRAGSPACCTCAP
jgi:serine/threonine protein kinase